MDIAGTLKTLREQNKLSQYRLAKLSGVSQGVISSIESNGREPSVGVIKRLCAPLCITLPDFFVLAVGSKRQVKRFISPIFEKYIALEISDQKIVDSMIDSLYTKTKVCEQVKPCGSVEKRFYGV